MTVTNNFLPAAAFKDLQFYCDNNDFKNIKVGNKFFPVLETPRSLLDFFKIDGYELILTFLRIANQEFDTRLNVHADNIVSGKKAILASVLYINDEDEVTPNGTMFWKHHQHGHELTSNVTDKEFNRLITEDSNDYKKWEQRDMVFAKPNRRLLYNAQLFHSKFPTIIKKGERKVLVCFYAKKTNI